MGPTSCGTKEGETAVKHLSDCTIIVKPPATGNLRKIIHKKTTGEKPRFFKNSKFSLTKNKRGYQKREGRVSLQEVSESRKRKTNLPVTGNHVVKKKKKLEIWN